MSKNIVNGVALFFEWSLILFLMVINQKIDNVFFHIFSIFVIGTRIHGLGILMHEASHFNLFTSSKWNDLLTQVFITGPVFISLDSYRKTHQLHHQYSLTDKDPTHTRKENIAIYNFPKKNNWQLITQLLKIFLGYGVYLSISDLRRNRKNHPGKRNFHKSIFKVIGICVLLLLLYKYQVLNIYLTYWIVPCLTVLPLLNYWRTISEHSAVNSPEPTRTVIYSILLRWLIAPYNVNYHLEHHLFPKKPWYKLTNLKTEETQKLNIGTTTYGFKQLWNEFVL